MHFGKTLILIGMVLIVVAWLLASGMPEASARDFDKLVVSRGGSITHTPNFPDEYRKMGFTRRLLQNSLLGFAGLICLGIGLDSYRREPATDDVEAPLPDGSGTGSPPVWKAELPPALKLVLKQVLTGVAVVAVSIVLWGVVLMLQA